MITSSARSATLEDTSWNLPDSQFCSKSKTEPKRSRHRHKFFGGGHRTEKVYTRRGDTAHIFLIGYQ